MLDHIDIRLPVASRETYFDDGEVAIGQDLNYLLNGNVDMVTITSRIGVFRWICSSLDMVCYTSF